MAERLQPLAYGGGQFQPQVLLDEPGGAALVADFNGDGRVDIWAGGRVLHNQSEGGHWIEIAAQGTQQQSRRSGGQGGGENHPPPPETRDSQRGIRGRPPLRLGAERFSRIHPHPLARRCAPDRVGDWGRTAAGTDGTGPQGDLVPHPLRLGRRALSLCHRHSRRGHYWLFDRPGPVLPARHRRVRSLGAAGSPRTAITSCS